MLRWHQPPGRHASPLYKRILCMWVPMSVISSIFKYTSELKIFFWSSEEPVLTPAGDKQTSLECLNPFPPPTPVQFIMLPGYFKPVAVVNWRKSVQEITINWSVLLKTQKVQFHCHQSAAVGKKKRGHRAWSRLYVLSFSSLTKEKCIKNVESENTGGSFFY